MASNESLEAELRAGIAKRDADLSKAKKMLLALNEKFKKKFSMMEVLSPIPLKLNTSKCCLLFCLSVSLSLLLPAAHDVMLTLNKKFKKKLEMMEVHSRIPCFHAFLSEEPVQTSGDAHVTLLSPPERK